MAYLTPITTFSTTLPTMSGRRSGTPSPEPRLARSSTTAIRSSGHRSGTLCWGSTRRHRLRRQRATSHERTKTSTLQTSMRNLWLHPSSLYSHHQTRKIPTIPPSASRQTLRETGPAILGSLTLPAMMLWMQRIRGGRTMTTTPICHQHRVMEQFLSSINRLHHPTRLQHPHFPTSPTRRLPWVTTIVAKEWDYISRTKCLSMMDLATLRASSLVTRIKEDGTARPLASPPSFRHIRAELQSGTHSQGSLSPRPNLALFFRILRHFKGN